MKWEPLILASLAAYASADGVTQDIAPDGGVPAGCNANFDGDFAISVAKQGQKVVCPPTPLDSLKASACVK